MPNSAAARQLIDGLRAYDRDHALKVQRIRKNLERSLAELAAMEPNTKRRRRRKAQ